MKKKEKEKKREQEKKKLSFTSPEFSATKQIEPPKTLNWESI